MIRILKRILGGLAVLLGLLLAVLAFNTWRYAPEDVAQGSAPFYTGSIARDIAAAAIRAKIPASVSPTHRSKTTKIRASTP